MTAKSSPHRHPAGCVACSGVVLAALTMLAATSAAFAQNRWRRRGFAAPRELFAFELGDRCVARYDEHAIGDG